MKKIFIIILLFSEMSVMAQSDRIDSLLNDIVFSDEAFITSLGSVKSDFLYAGLNLNNKTYFAGREIGTNLINVY